MSEKTPEQRKKEHERNVTDVTAGNSADQYRSYYESTANAIKNIAKINLAMMVLTVGLVLATWYQVSISRETMKNGLRAFVYATGAGFTKQDDGSAVLNIELANSGSTPARHVISKTTTCSWDAPGPKDLPDDFNFSLTSPNIHQTLIQPHGAVFIPTHIPPVDYDAMVDGKMRAAVWGIITYDDLFGAGHRLEFCFMYRGTEKSPATGNVSDVKVRDIFQVCHQHNCDDDDCPEAWGQNPAPCRNAVQGPEPY